MCKRLENGSKSSQEVNTSPDIPSLHHSKDFCCSASSVGWHEILSESSLQWCTVKLPLSWYATQSDVIRASQQLKGACKKQREGLFYKDMWQQVTWEWIKTERE